MPCQKRVKARRVMSCQLLLFIYQFMGRMRVKGRQVVPCHFYIISCSFYCWWINWQLSDTSVAEIIISFPFTCPLPIYKLLYVLLLLLRICIYVYMLFTYMSCHSLVTTSSRLGSTLTKYMGSVVLILHSALLVQIWELVPVAYHRRARIQLLRGDLRYNCTTFAVLKSPSILS